MLLLMRFDVVYLQAGLMIAAWGCHRLQEGQSRLCGCSVPGDHADYMSGKDLTEYDRAGEHVVTGFLSDFISALLLHHVCTPTKKLMVLQGDTDPKEQAAAAAEGAATAEAAAKAALADAVAAGPEARAKEGLSGSGCSIQGEAAIAELLGTSVGERGPADVQVWGVHSAGRGPASAGLGLAGAALPPAAGGALLAAERVGERGGNTARTEIEGRGNSGGGGGAAAGGEGAGGVAASGGKAGVAAAGRGLEAAAAGGGGGGGRAAAAAAGADPAAAGIGKTGTEVPSEGTGGTLTTAAAAGCEAGEGGVLAAEGAGGETTASGGAAAVAGVTGPDAAAEAGTKSSAGGSSQQEAVGEFSAGVLWLASADHAEVLGETLVEYHAENPLEYENVHYMVLKVLVELLLLQTGVTKGPSLDTAAQVIA